MVRVKRGTTSLKRRRSILKQTKGFRWGRKNKEKLAREALLHAGLHSFSGRKRKKRDFRRLWQNKISAAVTTEGLSYSRFINALSKKNIELDRKVLAKLAEEHPEIFSKILESVK
ncbi:MAG: 50S ribosomal protein L20 [bacterium]|nr:50S ribosomal protein L20 [bacterium]